MACSLSVLFSPQSSKVAVGANDEKHMFLGSPDVAQCRQREGKKKEKKEKKKRKEGKKRALVFSASTDNSPIDVL